MTSVRPVRNGFGGGVDALAAFAPPPVGAATSRAAVQIAANARLVVGFVATGTTVPAEHGQ